MNLFLFLLLPLSLIIFLQKNGFKFLTTIFIGILAAIIVCGFNSFFLTATHIVNFSFKTNFISIMIKQLFLPVFLVYGLFMIISRDSIEYKVKSFFPLICSFYIVYMPFFIIKGHSVNYSFYELFVEPAIFLTMISTISVLLKKIFDSENSKISIKLLYGLIIFIYLIIPALIQTQYILSIQKVFQIVLISVYILLPLTAYILRNFFDFKLNLFPIQ